MSEAIAQAPRGGRLKRRGVWLLLLAAAVTAAIVAAATLRRDDGLRHLTAKVQQGEIRDAVDATGTVNAVITVQVGSQVSGTIARLNADFNSRVHKGDVIAVIDPQLFSGALRQATADLENAKANVIAAEANLSKAGAALEQTKAEYDRAAALLDMKIGTQQALDLAKANYASAKASVDAARANIAQARAQVDQKAAAVSVARTNLDYTVIRSPIDGIVVARNVDVGQTVAASLQAPTVFTIAQDLTKMQVYAKVDESDVGRIGTGRPVTFKVDAFPKDLFTGTVSQVRMNPTTVQNVVTYDAIIDFLNPDLKLFPGMTAYVTIPVATAADVVKIPNAALRYKPPMPPEVVRALYAKYGIEEGTPAEAAPAALGARGPTPAGPGAHRAAAKESAVVWKLLANGTIEPVRISLGITDHTYTEVTGVIVGKLEPGDDVVTSSMAAKNLPPGAQGIRR
ncbi:MAG TPA: efflux RND transporter periplasmic adaptor subunit [Thermoanaerobaculia bacterium]|nr:efflux RND transporter periplasmic adaptor subunit [Thermoanaerobaculia bacterium]